jgi:hypothetical protein
MALRVARGLFRLWLVVSVLWIGGVAVETWWTFPVNDWVPAPSVGGNDPKSWGAIPLEEKDGRGIAKPVFDPDQWLRDETDKERRAAIRFAGLLALTPPLLLLALGSALVWAFRGFR